MGTNKKNQAKERFLSRRFGDISKMFAQQPNLPCKAMAAIEKRTYPALIQFLYRGKGRSEFRTDDWVGWLTCRAGNFSIAALMSATLLMGENQYKCPKNATISLEVTSEPEGQMLLWRRKTSREFVRWGLGSARRVAPVVFDLGIAPIARIFADGNAGDSGKCVACAFGEADEEEGKGETMRWIKNRGAAERASLRDKPKP